MGASSSESIWTEDVHQNIEVNGPGQVYSLWGMGSGTRSHRRGSHCHDVEGGSLYLRLDQRVLLDGAQLSSLSLPGGSAVLRGSLVSAHQDSRGGPCPTPILRSVTPTRLSAPGLGEGELPPPASSPWWLLWPTSGQSACAPPSLSSPLGDPHSQLSHAGLSDPLRLTVLRLAANLVSISGDTCLEHSHGQLG